MKENPFLEKITKE